MNDRTASLPLSLVNATERIIAGRYRMLALIGQGGMGAVYEAEHVESGQRLAVKVLLPDLANASEVAERFRREAKAAEFLDHPNIVKVLDLVSEDSALYLVMELVRGMTIGQLLDAGPIAPRRSLMIARQVLEALAHAHGRGIIHRDLKPDNVMVVNGGESGDERELAKLLDFGILKVVGDALASLGGDKLTQTGVVFGTPAYLSPEQALGRPIDARADLYSLGIVLFEMLTGRPPFRSPDPQTLIRMQVAAPAPSLASVVPGRPWCTPELEQFFRRALAKHPGLRFADATEMIAALDVALSSLEHLTERSK